MRATPASAEASRRAFYDLLSRPSELLRSSQELKRCINPSILVPASLVETLAKARRLLAFARVFQMVEIWQSRLGRP